MNEEETKEPSCFNCGTFLQCGDLELCSDCEKDREIGNWKARVEQAEALVQSHEEELGEIQISRQKLFSRIGQLTELVKSLRRALVSAEAALEDERLLAPVLHGDKSR